MHDLNIIQVVQSQFAMYVYTDGEKYETTSGLGAAVDIAQIEQ